MHIQPNTHLPIGPQVKTYIALLTQSSTNPPSVLILQNTFGTIIWTRDNTGFYIFAETSINKNNTTVEIAQSDITSGTKVGLYAGIDNGGGTGYVNTYNAAGSMTDGLLLRNLITIKQYT